MSNDPDPAEQYGGYAALTGSFLLATAGAVAGLERSGRLPRRVTPGDIALLGVATYQLSRTLTRDRVTAFLRAPFAEQREPAGRGEVESEAVGSGLRRTVGELAICPFCMTQWVAAAGLVGLCAAPRWTRFAAGILAVRTVAEAVNLGHEAAVATIDRMDDVKTLTHERAEAATAA
ncbi:MAG TPA: DUF1360 domain-containing protein [Gaiellales bacterium]|jgi:hypothetical protein